MNMKLIDRIKALKKRDKYVLSAIANLTWYCEETQVISDKGKTVPDSMTVAWFPGWTVELALLFEKKKKNKGE